MAVREVIHAFLTADRPEEVYQFALERVSPLVGATFASVYLVDGASELMRLGAAYNWPQRFRPWLGEARVRLGFGPSGEAASERRTIEVPDVFAEIGGSGTPFGVLQQHDQNRGSRCSTPGYPLQALRVWELRTRQDALCVPERFAPLGEGILEDAGEDVVRHSLRHAAGTGTDLWDSCWIGPPRAKLPPSRFLR